tara:strand:- start:12 stop:1898 length:1887 start_codon:yes stop_codon:yes gene_type:complete
MADKRIRLLVQAEVSKAVRNLNKLEKETDETKQSASELSSTFKSLFGAAVLGAGVRSIVQTASNFESLETSIIQLKGSTEAGQKAFKTFSNIAATTPFKLQNVVEAGVTVEAFGANSEDTLKAITDLAAYMRVDVVEAAGAFGRAFAGGAGAADVLRDRGVLTQVKLKTGFDDLSKMTLPQFRQALIDTLTDPDGTIAGSTDVLAATFSGKVSNMQDAVDLLQNAIGVRLIGDLGDMAVAVGDAARNAADFVNSLSPENIKNIEKNILIMASTASAFILYTKGAVMARTATLGLIRAAKFLLVFEAIDLIVVNISNNFEFFSKKVKEAQVAILEFFQNDALTGLVNSIQALPEAMLNMTPALRGFKEMMSVIGLTGKDNSEKIEQLKKEIAGMGDAVFKLDLGNLQAIFDMLENADVDDLILPIEELELAILELSGAFTEAELSSSSFASVGIGNLDGLIGKYVELGENIKNTNKSTSDSNKKTLEEQLTNMAEQGRITKSNALSTIKTKSKESSASYIASIFAGVGFPVNFILAGLASAAIDKLFEPLTKFQTGGSFITNKRTTLPIGNGIVVGDNASSMERIDITPLPSPTSSGNNITINISAPLVDETVVDTIIPAIRRAEKLNL